MAKFIIYKKLFCTLIILFAHIDLNVSLAKTLIASPEKSSSVNYGVAKQWSGDIVVIGVSSGNQSEYRVAEAICAVIKIQKGVRCLIESFAAVSEGIKSAADQKVDFLLIPANIPEEMLDTNLFHKNVAEQKISSLRSVMSLYSQAFTLVKRSSNRKISSFDTLFNPDVRVGLMFDDYTTIFAINDIMANISSAAGYDVAIPKIISMLTEQDIIDSLCGKQIDVAFFVSHHPNPLIQKIIDTCSISFIDMDVDTNRNPKKSHLLSLVSKYYHKVFVDPNFYARAKVKKHDGQIVTIGTTIEVVTSKFSNKKMVTNFIESIIKNMTYLHTSTPILLSLNVGDMMNKVNIKRHDAAEAWLSAAKNDKIFSHYYQKNQQNDSQPVNIGDKK